MIDFRMKYIVDSSAWIEYVEGSHLGQKVRELIVNKEEIYVINLIIAEVISAVKRKGYDVEIAYRAIVSNSKIANLTPPIAKEAGLLHAEIRKKIKTFGLADSLILISAQHLDAKILTGDPHFKNFKNVVFLGK